MEERNLIDKSRLGYLTQNQKIYCKALIRNFEKTNHNMRLTIINMANHPELMSQDEYQAMQSLSDVQQTQVITEVGLPF